MKEHFPKLLKKITPKIVQAIARSVFFKYRYYRTSENHKNELKRLRNKKNIKVIFFVIHESIWKFDKLFRLMIDDPVFEPTIVVCPCIAYSEEEMMKEMKQTFRSFEIKGYKVISTFSEKTEKWIDVKTILTPDIVFFTNPWSITRKEYQITNFLDTLTCYAPYGYKSSHLEAAHYDQLTHNLTWKFFVESKFHQQQSKIFARNKGKNTIVTGAPGMDAMTDNSDSHSDIWKIKDKSFKRIIWAPHHTIEGYGANLDYSTFLTFSDKMLSLAQKYSKQIQIAFKPHPLLFTNLCNPLVWGKQKTERYYSKWDKLENGQLVLGGYSDLFLYSDALIHDCASFLAEYLYTQKPVLFLNRDQNIAERFNKVGREIYSSLYHGETIEDIENFVDQVVIQNADIKQNDRIHMYLEYIKPPFGEDASTNIFNNLKQSLNLS